MTSIQLTDRPALPRPVAKATRARQLIRKHHVAIGALVVLLFIVYFPSLFMGRVISPNDVFYNYDPWRQLRSVDVQNPLLNDPATSYTTLMHLLRNDPGSFHWNRFVGGGIPGVGSVGSAVLSPFVLIPVLLLPLWAVYNGIILLKILVPFCFSYLWLREVGSGKPGAAAGAIVIAGAPIYAVWWMWQGTNATALYPALLWAVARMFHGKRNSVSLLTLLGVGFLLSGYPATIAYAAYLGVLYALYLAAAHRRVPVRGVLWGLLAGVLAAAITAPLVMPYVHFIQRTGYLEARSDATRALFYPIEHLRSLIDPYRLGNPASHSWSGSAALGAANNFIEATIYVGLLAVALSILGLVRSRSRERFFWLLVATAVVGLMFVPQLSVAVSNLPGIKYSPLTRLRTILPIPVGYLVASGAAFVIAACRRSGWGRRPLLRSSIPAGPALVLAIECALFAALFFPYLTPAMATIPSSPTIEYLRASGSPSRILPFFDDLWPNASELFQIEDIRSHFGSESAYRRIMTRIDPGSWGGAGTILQFNSLRTDLADPLLTFLNVKYLVEQPSIDIVRWKVLEATEPEAEATGERPLTDGAVLTRQIDLRDPGVFGIEQTIGIREARPDGKVTLTLIRPETGKAVAERIASADELRRQPKVYLPIRPHAYAGNTLILRIASSALEAVVLTRADGQVTHGLIRRPWILARELPDGKIFENLDFLPRFFAVWNISQGGERELLARKDLRLGETVLSDESHPQLVHQLAAVRPSLRSVRMKLLRYDGSEQRLAVDSAVPFLLASSEKLTPELTTEVDGRRVKPIRINALFAAVPVERGKHTIAFKRRLGRRWWPISAAGLLALMAIAIAETIPRFVRWTAPAAPRG